MQFAFARHRKEHGVEQRAAKIVDALIDARFHARRFLVPSPDVNSGTGNQMRQAEVDMN
jgi:hypothetical protein